MVKDVTLDQNNKFFLWALQCLRVGVCDGTGRDMTTRTGSDYLSEAVKHQINDFKSNIRAVVGMLSVWVCGW